MPVLMQKTMQDMQKMTERIAPEMQKIQESFVAEMSVAD
jgi:membrane protein insertase Oxa1/YidC/SpoIIIJ